MNEKEKAIDFKKAQEILHKYVKTQHILDHSLESSQVLKHLAKKLNQNEEIWAITGLLHDLDMDIIKDDYSKHAETTLKILEKEKINLPQESKNAILAHTECLKEMQGKYTRKTQLDIALAAGEQITGIITAYARMRPEKFTDIKIKSLNKKFKDKSFARNVNRNFINDIEKLGISKNEFFELSIKAIQEISEKIKI